MGKSQKHCAEWEKPDTGKYILHSSISMKFYKDKHNLQGQKADQ